MIRREHVEYSYMKGTLTVQYIDMKGTRTVQ